MYLNSAWKLMFSIALGLMASGCSSNRPAQPAESKTIDPEIELRRTNLVCELQNASRACSIAVHWRRYPRTGIAQGNLGKLPKQPSSN
jgi:hypothetical protein